MFQFALQWSLHGSCLRSTVFDSKHPFPAQSQTVTVRYSNPLTVAAERRVEQTHSNNAITLEHCSKSSQSPIFLRTRKTFVLPDLIADFIAHTVHSHLGIYVSSSRFFFVCLRSSRPVFHDSIGLLYAERLRGSPGRNGENKAINATKHLLLIPE